MTVLPTVLVSTENGPVRVNKEDFDLDQLKDAKDREYKPYKGDEVAEQSEAPNQINTDGPPLAAPSAPHFGEGEQPANIDPLKGAVAPDNVPTGLYVMKKGTGAKGRYMVVNEKGEAVTNRPPINPDGYLTEEDATKAITDLPH